MLKYKPIFDKIGSFEYKEFKDKLNISESTFKKICYSQKLSSSIMNKIAKKLNCNVKDLCISIDCKDKENFEPFVKWVGGKRQLMAEIDSLIPTYFNNYIEPFVGGGAVFCHICPERAIINDFNFELVTTYNVIKTKPKELMKRLDSYEKEHFKKGKSFFIEVREMDRDENFRKTDKVEIVARFIYLNKVSFNGMYRVNSSGFFNVPCNQKKEVKLYNQDNISLFAKHLKKNKIKIVNDDFEKVLELAQAGDFIYLDPPYDLIKDQTFDSYTKEPFGKEGQIRLANACKILHEKGCMFLLSNHNTELINELYKDFNIKVVNAKRMINSNGSKRTGCEEVLIFNYPKEVCKNEQMSE